MEAPFPFPELSLQGIKVLASRSRHDVWLNE